MLGKTFRYNHSTANLNNMHCTHSVKRNCGLWKYPVDQHTGIKIFLKILYLLNQMFICIVLDYLSIR